MDTGNSESRAFRIAVWTMLIGCLPLALLGALSSPNEYEGMGIDALDCDGPLRVYLFAFPALVIYGSGLVASLRYPGWRHRLAALLCLIVCLGLVYNLHRARDAAAAQAQGCTAR